MAVFWLEYPETGGKAQFTKEAAELWRLRGWIDTDPPPEPDLTKEPDLADGGVFPSEAEASQESVAESGEQVQESATRSSRRKRGEAAAEEA